MQPNAPACAEHTPRENKKKNTAWILQGLLWRLCGATQNPFIVQELPLKLEGCLAMGNKTMDGLF